jgi:hypothetical protein
MSDDDRERTVKARVSDADLLDAIESAEEGSSMAEVVRSALQGHLLDVDESDATSGLSPKARKGLRALRRATGPDGGHIEVDAAKSVVAEAVNIKKDSVRQVVFAPLRSKGLITPSARTRAAYIVVHPTARAGSTGGEAHAD